MKKQLYLSILIALLIIPSLATASTKVGTPKVWTVPAVYTADQEVTFYYDVTDVGFPKGIDLYLWAWEPTHPDDGNGDNSSDFAKLTYLGENIYCKKMIPTEYFHTKVSAFENPNWPGFWQQLKTKRDDLWSTEFAAPDSRLEWTSIQANTTKDLFVFAGKKVSVSGFTEKWTMKEPLTLIFNPNVFTIAGVTMKEFAETKAGFSGFKLHSSIDDWDTFSVKVKVWIPDCMDKTTITQLSNGYYSISMTTPFDYYSTHYANDGSLASTGLESDYEPTQINWTLVGIVNNDWGDTTDGNPLKAGQAVPYPDPQFSFFPQKFCSQDILTITRKYNGKLDGDLTYTLTAGSKVLTGTMPGNRDKREITFNLPKELAGMTDLARIHLTIKNSKDATVVDTDLPLVPLSEITYE